MKNFWIVFFVLYSMIVFMQSCSNGQNKTENSAAAEDIYTCPMHPQVMEHHPGNCPVCGMKLVKKNTETVSTNNIQLESLLKPTNEFVIASLPVITPQQKNITLPVKVY